MITNAIFRIGIFGYALAFGALPALADAFCPPCPNGVTEITIDITAEDVSSGLHGVATDTWQDSVRPSGLASGGDWVIDDASQFPEILRRTARRCLRIKHMSISSHGNLGYLSLGGTGISTANLESLIPADAACVMAPNARIDIGGCNVGRGCRGEDFLTVMAARMLRNGGGTIRAATSYTSTVAPGTIPHHSLNFQYQALTVDSALANPRWERTPQTTEACQERISDVTREELSEVIRLAERCSRVTESDLEVIRSVGAQMRRAFHAEGSAAPRGRGFGPSDRQAAMDFYVAFANWHYFNGKYSKLELSACEMTHPRVPPPRPRSSTGGRAF